MKQKHYSLAELAFEATLGGMGTETDDRTVPVIDISTFQDQPEECVAQLWQAATEVGFFQVVGHGIDQADIDRAFQHSEAFFGLPDAQKAQHGLKPGLNAGWEFRSQKRPSTGTLDQKESYQITRPHMAGLWPDDALPYFRPDLLTFEHQCWSLGMTLLSAFARALGFPDRFFHDAHDPAQPDFQSTLRLLHYLPLEQADTADGVWRAGAHTDFDCLTMVFQKQGQGGLQLCPGLGAEGQQVWSSVPAVDGVITCNIGDMLMRWSDDRLKSTLHRVRMPRAGEDRGARYSMAYFCQANRNVVIQGPGQKYPPITAADYLRQRIDANFTPEQE